LQSWEVQDDEAGKGVGMDCTVGRSCSSWLRIQWQRDGQRVGRGLGHEQKLVIEHGRHRGRLDQQRVDQRRVDQRRVGEQLLDGQQRWLLPARSLPGQLLQR
jgi:hypothetical protein